MTSSAGTHGLSRTCVHAGTLLTSWTSFVSESLKLQMSRYPLGERLRRWARHNPPLGSERSSLSRRAVSHGGSHFGVLLAICRLFCRSRQRHAPHSVLFS